jgi:predicted Zn-dependent protease
MKKLVTVIFLLFLCGCATSPTGRSQLMLVSPQQAISASKEAYIQTLRPFEKKGQIDTDPVTSSRIRYITGRLIAQAIRLYPYTDNWEWSVKVIDDPDTVNAWCMAGGKMAIYTGIIQKINATDDEIAQVMGHEISHALANHTAEKMSMAMATQIGMVGLAVASKNSRHRGAILSGSALAAALAVNLPNSRTAESEADTMGIELAALAGYNPRAAVSLWRKMAETGGKKIPQFLSTHPSPANRQAVLADLAQQMMPYYLDKSPRPVYPLP